METSEMIDVLRSVEGFVIVASGDPGEKLVCTAEHFKEIGDRLEELEAALAERECGTMKASSPTMEWISVEDRLPEENGAFLTFDELGNILREVFDTKEGWELSYDGEVCVTHWMPLPDPPKPKVPTFKDVFLEKFPNARLYGDSSPITCRANIFGGKCLMRCTECWNQPYFEEEGETDA